MRLKLFILFLFFTLLTPLFCQKNIIVNADNISIEQVFKQIEEQSGYKFSYNPGILKGIPPVTCHIQIKNLASVLDIIFQKTDIQFVFVDNFIILKKRSKTRTISGYLYDDQSSETLIAANIFDSQSGKGTVSNNFGFYSLSIPLETARLYVSYVGYKTKLISVNTLNDTVLSIRLEPSSQLQEVVVKGKENTQITSTETGKLSMNSVELKSVPAFLGESDVIKTLQLTPGVAAGTEGVAGMYVRGGNIDENLYMVDGNPIYHVNHLMGIFSTFNPDAVKIMNFYKGSFPARYGGRLSSVVDLRMNDGDMKKYTGTFSIGLLSSRINYQGPIIKDKTSFSVSLRRTYFDLLTRPTLAIINSIRRKESKNYETVDIAYDFYDFNGKISHKFSEKSRLYLSLYSGKDNLFGKYGNYSKYSHEQSINTDEPYYSESSQSQSIKMDWGTQLASLNWAYQFNHKLFANTTLVYSKYLSDITSTNAEWDLNKYQISDKEVIYEKNKTNSSVYGSGIEDVGLRTDFDFSPYNNHYIRFGSSFLNHLFHPEHNQVLMNETSDGIKAEKKIIYANDSVRIQDASFYIEDEMNLTSRLKINAGLHFSGFFVQGKSYLSVQPRFSSRYLIDEKTSLKASYAKMNQYLHLLQSSIISLPNDLWVPITKNIKPLISHQVSAGIYHDYRNFEISMEGYYKTSQNQIEYKEGAELLSVGKNWQDRVVQGLGKSYGLEWMINKKSGNTTGWIGYTLAWAKRHFPNGEINGGKPYFATYDNRHKINVVVVQKLSKKTDLSLSWIFASGNRATIPMEKYQNIEYHDYYIQERNNFKMPDYHRLDLSFNFYRPRKNGKMGIWNVSIYNTYFRKNAFMIFPSTDMVYEGGGNWGKVIEQKSVYKQVSVFPIIPSFSYTLKF